MIEHTCVCPHASYPALQRQTLRLIGARSAGSETPGDTGTSQPKSTHNCECSKAHPGSPGTTQDNHQKLQLWKNYGFLHSLLPSRAENCWNLSSMTPARPPSTCHCTTAGAATPSRPSTCRCTTRGTSRTSGNCVVEFLIFGTVCTVRTRLRGKKGKTNTLSTNGI